MSQTDPECTALHVPEHLHRLQRPDDQTFSGAERLYRRYKLGDRKLKAAISFTEMSVNWSRYSPNPGEVLLNTRDGGRYEGYGVVSFPVEALWNLNDPSHPAYGAKAFHDPEKCNYSHALVISTESSIPLPQGKDLPKLVRKSFRKKMVNQVTIEIPVEQAGGYLDWDEG